MGLLPDDEELARALRRTRKPLAVAVNKVDRPSHELRVAEFHALGFERVRGVSAEHGGGAFDLLEELVAALPPPAEAPVERAVGAALRVALVGRPNAGKSSLLNRILGAERVVVSEEPGTTRDAIDIRVERDGHAFVFIDTAGLRRPGRRDRLAERGSALMALRAIERRGRGTRRGRRRRRAYGPGRAHPLPRRRARARGGRRAQQVGPRRRARVRSGRSGCAPSSSGSSRGSRTTRS